jgi:hypothetical protein
MFKPRLHARSRLSRTVPQLLRLGAHADSAQVDKLAQARGNLQVRPRRTSWTAWQDQAVASGGSSASSGSAIRVAFNRCRRGDRAMIKDTHVCGHHQAEPRKVFAEVWVDGDLIDEQVTLEEAELRGLKIVECCFCEKPAVQLDHLWPSHVGFNRCQEHLGAPYPQNL